MRGRSTCWSLKNSASSAAWPAAVIGNLSIAHPARKIKASAPRSGARRGVGSREIVLQRSDFKIAGQRGFDALGRRDRARKCGVIRSSLQEGGAAKRLGVAQRGRPFGGVEHQLNGAVAHGVGGV